MIEQQHALRDLVGTHGSFLRRDALALGIDDRALGIELRAGRLVRVRHGAYAFADEWAGLSAEEHHRRMVRAVLRVGGPRVAASHHSAALLHGMDVWGSDLSLAHVTRLGAGAGRIQAGVVHHEGLCFDDDLTSVADARCTKPARAALESALLGGLERGLVTVDSGLRQGLFDPSGLAAQHELMSAWPGSRHLQLVTRLADGRAESVGESRARYLFFASGIPMPQLQYEVYVDGRLVGRVDFAWPEAGLLGEFDGRVKYSRHLRSGEDPADVVFREKRREDLLREATGWRMVRLTWTDLDRPRETAARVKSLLRQVA